MTTLYAKSPDGTRVAYDCSGSGPAIFYCMAEAQVGWIGTK